MAASAISLILNGIGAFFFDRFLYFIAIFFAAIYALEVFFDEGSFSSLIFVSLL